MKASTLHPKWRLFSVRLSAPPQVIAFDFGGSIRAAALAMDGDWHDLGGGLTDAAETSVNLQPLSRIDNAAERSWASDWIAGIVVREGVPTTPEVKEHIWSALTSLASAPIEERTITGLAVLLQSNDLKQALKPYCLGGAHHNPRHGDGVQSFQDAAFVRQRF